MMVSGFKFVFLLVLSSLIQGIKWEGKCPKAATSHNLDNIPFTQGSFLVGVPFSGGHPSNLFIEGSPDYLRRSLFQQWFTISGSRLETTIMNGKLLAIHKVIEVRNGTLILKSSLFEIERNPKGFVVYKNVSCQSIDEQVQLWYEDEFIIIWSCLENDMSTDHDEALLVVFPHFGYNPNDAEFSSLANRFKVIAKNYISTHMIEAIDWSSELHQENTSITILNPFYCLLGDGIEYKIVELFWIVYVLLSVFSIAICIIVCKLGKKVETRRIIVMPLNQLYL